MNIEFARVKILRNRNGEKLGFSLYHEDTKHDFRMSSHNAMGDMASEEDEGESLEEVPTIKTWIKALDQWVIRFENLKKYSVLSEIGRGG